MPALYNEVDPDAARWLDNLIADGLVPGGRVDRRSIVDLDSADVAGAGQRHFFAGIAGWGLACRLAGIPDDFDIWTGSCPCQPYSVAGRRRGDADARNLWPAFFRLIAECRPAIVVGEQVAQAAGREWLAGVRADLESAGYACGGADLPACSVGAPHIRYRLFWCGVRVEHAAGLRSFPGLRDDGSRVRSEQPRCVDQGEPGGHADDRTDGVRRLGHPDSPRLAERRGERGDAREEREAAERADGPGGVEHAKSERRREGRPEPGVRRGRDAVAGADAHGGVADTEGIGSSAWDAGAAPGITVAERPALESERRADSSDSSFWSDAIWLQCHDGRARRAQPGVPLLVARLPRGVVVVRASAETREISRVAAWRGFGNAIVPQVGAVFLRAVMQSL